MSIQTRLSLIFITLLIFGVTAVSSYSIVFIRDYLLSAGSKRLIRDTNTYAIAFKEIESNRYQEALALFQSVSEYGIVLVDVKTLIHRLESFKNNPTVKIVTDSSFNVTIYHDKTVQNLYSVSSISDSVYITVIQTESKLFEPVKTIRWIIYSGMFISIVLILVVSTITARSVSRPILHLTDYAESIAEGKNPIPVLFNRNDEMGTLSNSLNKMATTLKEDTLKIQQLYDRHRQFYVDMTHEVRNPLHTIGGSLELLELEQLPATERQTYIDHARNQVERLNRMFTDLLTLQKFDSHEYRLNLERVNLAEIVQSVCRSYRNRAEKKGIQLVSTNDSVYVMADKDKIEQVFDNIVLNSIRYSEATELKLVLIPTEKTVKIVIQDNGIGMQEEDAKHLFVRFYRADISRSREKGGSGLGLSVVKSILDAHEATFHVETKPNNGFRFEFELKKG